MAGSPFNVMGQYVASVQRAVIEVSQAQRSLFLPNGDIALRGNIVLNGHSITGAGEITVNTLNYTTLNPPVSSGGNMTGPLSSTDNSVVRYDGTTGQLVQDSSILISDDAKIEGPGGVVDFGTLGSLNITAVNGINVNGLPATASSSTTVVDSDIVVWNLTNGRLIKTSSIPVSSIATKLPLAGGTMSGAINMGGNSIINALSISGTVKTSLTNELLTSTATGVSDSEIVVFNSTTGKIAKASGVLVGTIASKLSLAGGTMSGAINMGGFGLTNVDFIAGTVKTSQVNDLVTSVTGVVTDSNIPVWNSTTGRVLKDSGVPISTLTIGAVSSIDHAITRFSGITGKVIQSSTMTLSDDAKLAASGGTIDMSTSGVINLVVGGSAQVNGSIIATASTLTSYVQGPASAVNNNLASYNLTTGKLIKDSGILATSVVLGPATATDNSVARFDLTTGKLLQNSIVTISDDAKIAGTGGTVDLSTAGILDLQATSVRANGVTVLTSSSLTNYVQGPASAVNNNLASYDLTTGKLIKDSGVLTANVVQAATTSTDRAIARFSGTTGRLVQNTAMTISDDSKISANSSTIDMSVLSAIDLQATNVLINGSAAAKISDLASYVQGPGSAVNDNIATYNLATGKLIKDSGVAIGQIANKLPLAGGTMSGNIDLGTNNLTNVGSISGTVKTNVVNDLITTSTGIVVDGTLPVWNSTTGRVLKDSGIAATALTIGAASSTDHALARFSGLTGKVIQNSTMSLSDDAKLSANSGTIDMSAIGTINLIASNTLANGNAIITTSDVTDYVTGPGSAVNDNIATYNLTSGKLIKDSGVAIGQIANKLPLAGGTMVGSINMGGFSVTNAANIAGTVKTSAVNDIVTSTTGTVVDSDIAVFDSTTGRLIKNSSVQVSVIATKLPLAGGTMLGTINMNSNSITNASLLTFPSNNVSIGGSASGGSSVAIGNGTTTSVLNSVAIGSTCTGGTQNSVAIGNQCNSSGAGGITIGGGTLGSNNSQSSGIAIGSNIVLSNGLNGIAIGAGSGIGLVDNAIAIGTSASNGTASSFLFGNSAIVNIRPNNNALCDLGTTSARFKDLNISGSIAGPTNSRTVDNIVSNSGAGTSGRVATFVSDKVIQDGGTLLSDLATSASVSSTYLAKAGGTMTGSIAMSTNNITNIGSISGATKTSVVDSIVTSSAVSAVDSDIAIFDSTTGKIIKGSSVQVSTIATKLPLAGGTMSGAIAMASNNITNIGTISGTTNSRSADNIVSCTGSSVAGQVTVFSDTTGKVVQDGGTLLSALATNASVSATYLAKSGGTMTGDIIMNSNRINNVVKMSADPINDCNVVWGTGSTLITPGNNVRLVLFGRDNSVAGFSCVSIGDTNVQTVGAGNCIMVGAGMTIVGNVSAGIGTNNSITGNNSYTIGDANTTTVSSGFVLGRNATNSTTNSVIFGDTNVVNIRPNGNATCDLGTSSARFKNIYSSGSLIGATGIDLPGAGTITVASTNATEIVLARAGVPVYCTGIFSTTVAFGSWYSTTTYNPAFSAGINRLTPPSSATAGLLIDFTHSLGVLTYTGTRTRVFKIEYDITWRAGSSGANMIFFNSVGASTVIAVQTQAREQVNVGTSALFRHTHFSDLVELSNGYTVQLAGQCATLTSAVAYQFVSCKISGHTN